MGNGLPATGHAARRRAGERLFLGASKKRKEESVGLLVGHRDATLHKGKCNPEMLRRNVAQGWTPSESSTRIWLGTYIWKRKRRHARALKDALPMTQRKQDPETKVKEREPAAALRLTSVPHCLTGVVYGLSAHSRAHVTLISERDCDNL